jgi:hypothetical protein
VLFSEEDAREVATVDDGSTGWMNQKHCDVPERIVKIYSRFWY